MPHSTFAPAGWPTVVPRIAVDDPAGLVAFIAEVFDAVGEYNATRPSELRLNDSLIMVSGSELRGVATAFLYVYVQEVDATYRRAMDAGATSVEEPWDTPYGDRRATVTDAWDNIWQIATTPA